MLIERIITIALMAAFLAAGVYAVVVGETVLILKAFASALLLPIPRFAATKLRLKLGMALPLSWCLFMLMAVLMGSFFGFYYLVPAWDKILHASSGAMSAIAAFWILERVMDKLANPEKRRSALRFIVVMSVVAACTVAMLWEVYEFTADRLFDLNFQRYKEDPVAYSGLIDTMVDMICGGGAGLAASYVMYRLKLWRLGTEAAE